VFTCVRWKVTLCDPIWQVTLRTYVIGFRLQLYCTFTFTISGGSMKKNIWGPGPSSFGRQQWLGEITIQPIKNVGSPGKIWGPVPPGPNLEPPLFTITTSTITESLHTDRHRARGREERRNNNTKKFIQQT